MIRKSVFVLLILFAAAFSMHSSADAEVYRWNCERDGNWQYEVLKDNTACIVGYMDPDAEGDLTIPDQVGGHAVTKVDGLRSMDRITKVIFPDSVKEIRDRAFYFNKSLKEAVFPSSLVSIGSNAFGFCPLESIEIPESVTSIGDSAFTGTRLKSVQFPSAGKLDLCGNPFAHTNIDDFTVPEDHPNLSTYQGVLFDKIEKRLISYPNKFESTYTIPKGIRIIGAGAFNGSPFKHIIIPETIVEIGDGAFMNSSLTEAELPDSVQRIGNYAFLNCGHLECINLGEGLSTIGEEAFSSCSRLTGISIPQNVRKVGPGAFESCNMLTEIHVSDRNPFFHVSNHCLIETESGRMVASPQGLNVETFEVPDGVISIGERAFQGARIRNIVLSDSVKALENLAFFSMPSLETVHLNNGLMSISFNCFMNSENLAQITIPRSVGYIGKSAFYGNHRVSAQVEKGSYAESYCQRNNIPFTYISEEDETGSIPVSAPVLGFSGLSAEELADSAKDFLHGIRAGKSLPDRNQAAEFPGTLNTQELKDFGKALFESGSAAACPECMEGTWLISLRILDEVDEDLSSFSLSPKQFACTADQFLRQEGKDDIVLVNMSRNGVFYQFEKKGTNVIHCTVGLFESSEEMFTEYFAGNTGDVYSSCLIWETDEDDSYSVRSICYDDESDPVTRSESITRYLSDGQCLGSTLQK